MANKPAKKVAPVKKGKEGAPNMPTEFAFGKENYMLMIIGVVVLIIGFALMYGPADGDIFSFRRITLAPIVVLAGFVIEVFAIFKKPKEDTNN